MTNTALEIFHVSVVEDNPILADALAIYARSLRNISASTYDSRAFDPDAHLNADCRNVVVIDPSQLEWHASTILEASSGWMEQCLLIGYTLKPTAEQLQMAIGKRFNAFMSKRSGLREFEAALEVANLGGFYLDPICMKVLWSDRADVSNSSSVSSCLSDRERSVLVLVARGHTAKEIAIQLDVSCKTVETYRSRAMRKLSLVGRAEIVDFVAQNRLTA